MMSAGSAPVGSRTIRNSTGFVGTALVVGAQRGDALRDRLLPGAVRVLAEQRLRRQPRDRVHLRVVSAVPICATDSGTPA